MKKPTLKKRLTFDPEESRSYVKIMLISGILLLAATLILLTVVKNAVEVEPGWYSVDSAEREDFPLYDSGIHFTYYFDGDSTAIRTEQKKLAAGSIPTRTRPPRSTKPSLTSSATQPRRTRPAPMPARSGRSGRP